MPQSPHFGAVPFFFRCRYRSSPPGVLTTRTLLDLVLYGCRRRCNNISIYVLLDSLSPECRAYVGESV
jgi:hypothetical protein